MSIRGLPWIDELVHAGVLHQERDPISRREKEWGGGLSEGKPLRLHRHQAGDVRTAQDGYNYVLTTGTGSGKSFAYIVPIVDQLLRRGSGRGIRVPSVYPMNALANSQYGELEKFLYHGYADGRGPVTFVLSAGEESEEQRNTRTVNQPDISETQKVYPIYI